MGTASPHPLLAARLRAGLTQEQLGVRAGTTAKTVASIERGYQMPQRTTAAAIAAALGLDADDLFEKEEAA
jgi:transcriptional regulator with XRE-family HTH domain